MSTTPDLLTPRGSTTTGVFADAAGSPTLGEITPSAGSGMHLGVGGAIRWGRVRSQRNSYCNSARLSQLDWGEWWEDGGMLVPGTYLHVPRRDDETVHRVFCRHSDYARLGWRSGDLWWVYSATVRICRAGEENA